MSLSMASDNFLLPDGDLRPWHTVLKSVSTREFLQNLIKHSKCSEQDIREYFAFLLKAGKTGQHKDAFSIDTPSQKFRDLGASYGIDVADLGTRINDGVYECVADLYVDETGTGSAPNIVYSRVDLIKLELHICGKEDELTALKLPAALAFRYTINYSDDMSIAIATYLRSLPELQSDEYGTLFVATVDSMCKLASVAEYCGNSLTDVGHIIDVFGECALIRRAGLMVEQFLDPERNRQMAEALNKSSMLNYIPTETRILRALNIYGTLIRILYTELHRLHNTDICVMYMPNGNENDLIADPELFRICRSDIARKYSNAQKNPE